MVEVLSDSTRQFDLGAKQLLASQQAVPAYLVIDQNKRIIQESNGEQWSTINKSVPFPITLHDGCTVAITANDLFDESKA